MFYLVPGHPLRSFETGFAALPQRARLRTDAVSLVPVGRRTLAIHRPTGSWAYLDDRERELLETLDGSTVEEATAGNRSSVPGLAAAAEFLWRRGVLSASGQRTLAAVDLEKEIDQTARQAFALLLVMSSTCALACRYCYLSGAESTRPGSMTFATGAEAIRRALTRGEPQLTIDFGEIAGSESLFRSLVEEARGRAAGGGKNLSLLIQTSGIRLEPEMADFLVRNGVSVGLSLDGPARLHDQARRFHHGGGTHAAAARSLSVLVERGIDHWVFATIARHNVSEPEAVLEHFHALRATDIAFKAVLPVGDARAHWPEVGISMDEYAVFTRAAVRFALRRGVDSLDIGHRRALLRALGDRRGWLKACIARNCHCGEQYVVVEPDGALTPCPRFSGLRDDPARISFRPSSTAIGVEVAAAASRIPEPCHECPWVRFCGGGCAFSGAEDPQCASYRASYQAIFEDVIPSIVESQAFQPGRTGPFRLSSLDPWADTENDATFPTAAATNEALTRGGGEHR